jgi:hypothetical protein
MNSPVNTPLKKIHNQKNESFNNENNQDSLKMMDVSLHDESVEIKNENEKENSPNRFSNFLNFVTFGFVDDSSPVNSNKYDNDDGNGKYKYDTNENDSNSQKLREEESFVIKNPQKNSENFMHSPSKGGKWNIDASTQTDYSFSDLNYKRQKSTSLKCEVCTIM